MVDPDNYREVDTPRLFEVSARVVDPDSYREVDTPRFFEVSARVVELVDTQDLKSCGLWLYGFKSRPGYLESLVII